MILLTDALERVRSIVFRSRQERDLDDELRFHIEREVEERVRRGEHPAAARRAAVVALGGVERRKEEVRDARSVRPFEDVLSDVRFASRTLRRNAIFSLTAILVLGLAIGASTTVFAVADAVLFRSLPYPEPERLVRIYHRNPQTDYWQLSTVDAQAIDEQQRSFEAVGFLQRGEAALSGTGAPEHILIGRVNAGFFRALQASTAHGRLIEARDEALGAPPVVVVSQALAERTLGGAAAAVGRSITLDGLAHTVIGVVAPTFEDLGGARTAAWPVLQLQVPERRGPFWLRSIGRVRDGISLDDAARDLAGISERLFPLWASSFRDRTDRLTVLPLRDAIVGTSHRQVGLFAAAVALVLLIAIANVATLFLVRASARGQELAVRTALGAGRARLVRLLVTESLVLTIVAGAVGILFTAVAVRFAHLVAADLPRIRGVELNAQAVGFAALAALVSGLLVSISPVVAALARRGGVTSGTEARRVGTSRQTNIVRGAFVVAEFALALPLLLGAGLLLNSFLRLQQVDPGFDPRGTVMVTVALPQSRYAEPADRLRFWQRLELGVTEKLGAAQVGLTSGTPPDVQGDANNFDLIDHPVAPGSPEHLAPWMAVTNGFFEALKVPLLDGRMFTPAHSVERPPVVLVSRAWANRYFPNENAVGRRMISGGCTTCEPTTVIGVVGDVKYQGLAGTAEAVYTPVAQFPAPALNLVAHTSGAPSAAFRAIRDVVAGLDAELPVTETTMQAQLDATLADPFRWTTVLGSFAAAAALLAALGIFGLMSYVVRQRRREIGVRMALGARPSTVAWMIIGRGMRYAAVGVAIGLVVAFLEARWLRAFLFGVGAMDPATLVAGAALLLSAALLACWLPGRRAARIHPVEAIAAD